MASTTLIIGESGSGKSSSLRNLNSKETFIINVLDKPLPFRGAIADYTISKNGATEGNYFATDDYAIIISLIQKISLNRLDIKTIIIDDFQYIMGNEFIKRATEKGYDKFSEIAQHAWKILKELSNARRDLDCFVLSHSVTDENGKSKCKTIGKMLDEKISLEGMFTIILHSLIVDGKYKFLNSHDGFHIAKAPMGLFDEALLDNDLAIVKEKMNDYFNADIPQ
jgi:hypothetical protein